MSMPVASQSFRIVRGEPKPWRRIGASGVQSTYWFCGDCGGRVFGEKDARRPEIRAVRAGTLDDTAWLRPVAHVYMRSAQPWEQISDAECFEIMPKDFWSLADKWQQLWQAT
jgi:hypothetical protein